MAKAYLDQIRATLDAATIAEIERLIADRDDSALGDVLAVGVFAALMELIRSGYMAGAKAEVGSVPRSLGKQELDVNADGAQSWLAQHIATLKAQMAMDQVDGISVTVSSGLQAGRSPRQIALDLAGRVSKQTGRRTGGTVGLPGNFSQYVADARTQLRSGDPEQLRKYLTRTRRDKRFDAMVMRALKAGTPVTSADADRIAGRYADRLLQTHAQMIARTEALESFSAGRDRVYEQLVERGLPREAIVRTGRPGETRRCATATPACRVRPGAGRAIQHQLWRTPAVPGRPVPGRWVGRNRELPVPGPVHHKGELCATRCRKSSGSYSMTSSRSR